MADNLIKTSFQSAIHGVEVYGLILMELDGRIVTWNRGAEQLLGFSEMEVLGQHFRFIFTSEDREGGVPEKEMATALQTGHAYDDRWHLCKDQSQIYVNGGLCLLKSEKEVPLGFVKIIRDQTEKKGYLEKIEDLNANLIRAQANLEDYASTLESKVDERTHALNQRNKELQDFSYSIAHDLRAPLRNIQAMAEVVLEDYGALLDSKGKEYLERIAKSGAHLDRLTLDLLTYTRFSREEVLLTSVNLEDVIGEVVSSLGENIAIKGLAVEVQRPLPSVRGQHSYVAQILGNFLSNALKFVGNGPRPAVAIWAESGEGRVRIYVKDNGIGIPLEYQEKVFLLFERLNPRGGIEGTGAGLAIARKAAQRMSGEIGILPDAGEGCTFWLELGAFE